MDLLGVLSRSRYFSGLSEGDLRTLLDISKLQTYGPREMIFCEGEHGHGFFVVVQGLVEIFKLSPEGKKQILHIFGPGEPFGEVVAFEGERFPANAQALKPSRVLYFPKKDFSDLLRDNPHLALRMLGVLSRRLRELTTLLENISLREVTNRLASFLFYMSQKGKRRVLHLEFSKGQLANLLGTVPETLSRALRRLSEEGLIEVRGREIVLKDPPKLLERSALVSP